MGEVRFTAAAKADIQEAWVFVAEQNPDAADRLLDAIDEEARLLARAPRLGKARPRLMPGIRSWARPIPFVIFYAISGGEIVVVRVLHQARDAKRVKFQVNECRAPYNAQRDRTTRTVGDYPRAVSTAA